MRKNGPNCFKSNFSGISGADPRHEIQLVWPGKSSPVNYAFEPFGVHTRITEPRKQSLPAITRELFDSTPETDQKNDAWLNKLIRGDNKCVVSSLIHGPLRKDIQAMGGVKLIYIDPPFHVGTDFSAVIPVGKITTSGPQYAIEHAAYSDTWEQGLASYLSMIHHRLILMRDLLAMDGSIWVHCDWKVNFLIRAIMNEVFGEESFRNEIIWYYRNKIPDTRKRQYTNSTDTIYYYTRSAKSPFNWQFDKRDKPIKVSRMKKINGKKIYLKDENGKGLYDVRENRTADNVWQFPLLHAQPEILGYPTQKPEKLLERIILTASRPGDLVADFFCGSGTTLAVAERLGRRWIGCDVGRIAVQTSLKRLVLMQRSLAAEGKPYQGFEVLSQDPMKIHEIGKFPTTSRSGKGERSCHQDDDYTKHVLMAYEASFHPQGDLFHGEKQGTAVAVTSIGKCVETPFLRTVLHDAFRRSIARVDVLGEHFGEGLQSLVLKEAPSMGVRMCLKRVVPRLIPQDRTQTIRFHFENVLYMELTPTIYDRTARVTVMGIGFLGQDDEEPDPTLHETPSKPFVILSKGNIVRISKNKKSKTLHEIVSRNWEDWIDYWAVDFEYGNTAENTDGVSNDQAMQDSFRQPVFREHWQSFRTRRGGALEITSATHSYAKEGQYTIAVRMTDILGNEAFERVVVQV